MPRYFFNLDDHVREPDEEGTEIGSDEQARTEAVMFASAWLRDNPAAIFDGTELRIDLVDEGGTRLFSVVTRGEPGDDPARNGAPAPD